jgi:Tol biopolymer transport system component
MNRKWLLCLGLLASAACSRRADGPDVDYRVAAMGESPFLIRDVELSPDGSRMAYTMQVEGLAAIYVAGADGSNPVRLTHGVWDQSPYWSPDGRWLAYYSDENADVWVVPSAGGEARQLTTGPANDNPIGWMPDGSGVLVYRQGVGDAATLVAPIDGGPVRPLFEAPAGNIAAMPSPDGTTIGFFVTIGGRTTLWVKDVAGGAARQLTTEGLEGLGHLNRIWAPDSKHIVYQSRRTGTSDLWVADVETGALRQVTDDIRDDYGATWSPDGRWILFESTRGGQEDQWVVPAEGGPARRVTSDADLEEHTSWAPDGHAIVYGTMRLTNGIEVRGADGGAPRTLVSLDGYVIAVGQVEVSRDGRTVLFVSNRSGAYDIWSVPVAGGEMTQLASSPTVDDDPAFSPDGQWIVFSSRRRGTADLWIMPAAGGEPRQLTDWPSNEWRARWSPDGTTIAFVSNRDASQPEVWTIPAAGGAATRVTRGAGGVGYVQWSRDGRTLFYDGATAAGSRQLFRVPASGGTPRGLTHAEGNASISNWGFDVSPDGAQIAYAYLVGGWGFVETVPVEGGAPRRFSTDTARVYQIDPRWSPDGSRIAISDFNYETNLWNLLVVPATEGAGRRLPAAPDAWEQDQRWTPDGRSLVYRSARTMVRFVTADVSRVLAATEP